MLTAYCQNVLALELAKPDYGSMTSDQGWEWLTQPVLPPPIQTATQMLTPVVFAHILGPAKAESVALAIKNAFPTIADHLLDAGVDPTSPFVKAFLSQMVAGGVLTKTEVDAVAAAAIGSVQPPSTPARFDQRFSPTQWPHVSKDGSIGTEEDQAIHGFPNSIDRTDFNAAWTTAGRK